MRLNTLESRVFLALVIGITLVFLWMVRSFLLPVFWAAVLATLFHPLYLRMVRALRGHRAVAAFLAMLVVIVIVLVPLTFLAIVVGQQAIRLYQRVAEGDVEIGAMISYVESLVPRATGILERFRIDITRIQEALETAAAGIAQYVATQALTMGQNAVWIAVMFALTLYLLFFFFRDGERLRAGLIRAIPMGDDRERLLFRKFADVSRATVQGTLVVAAVQGAIGGVLFAAVGIQAAAFWGVVMGVLSLLPAVGASLVWIPAAIMLIATGELGRALILIVGGSLVVGLIDNLLRPILVGRQSQMPDYLVLLATLGGLTMFGISGFVAGPIIAAFFLVTWQMFADEYAPLDGSVPAVAAVAVDTQGDDAVVTVESTGEAEKEAADGGSDAPPSG